MSNQDTAPASATRKTRGPMSDDARAIAVKKKLGEVSDHARRKALEIIHTSRAQAVDGDPSDPKPSASMEAEAARLEEVASVLRIASKLTPAGVDTLLKLVS